MREISPKLIVSVLLGLAALGGVIWIYQSPTWSVAGVLDRVEAAGPVPFFLAQALLPIVGVAVSPFLLVSGATFGIPVSIVGTAIAQAVSLLITYWIATRWLKRLLQKRLLEQKYVAALLQRQSPQFTAFLVSVMPGPSNCVKSYVMALTGVRLKYYMLIAWPVMMGYDTLTILFGEHLLTGDWWWGLGIFVLIMAVALASRWFWRHFVRRQARVVARQEHEAGATWQGQERSPINPTGQ